MPIRREYRKFYGAVWRSYREALILAHGRNCSVCGREVLKYLNFAHVSHDPRSSEIRPMCGGCHNRHDAGHRRAIARRNRALAAGQLWLWADVEWAPFPSWLTPTGRAALATGPNLSLF